jgi:glycosyltransferase involved in cell wall biosynthesis
LHSAVLIIVKSSGSNAYICAMKDSKLHVLHLARWYPHRDDTMLGLFVKRHVEAVGTQAQSDVVFAHPVSNLALPFEVDAHKINEQVYEVLVYYKDFTLPIPILSQLIKGLRYYKAVQMGIRKVEQERGRIDFVHVHVLTRMGWIACRYAQRMGIRFGITEHWSRYLPQTGNFKGALRKWMTRRIVAQAAFVSTVTENLHQAMLTHALENPNYFVLPNVLNPAFEQVEVEKEKKFTFVHVSTFEDKSKNISGIIRVVAKLAEKRSDFRMHFIGDGMDKETMEIYAQERIANKNCYAFAGLLEDEALARQMAAAHVLLIFSNYENMPVVINEGLALGLPILATSVGGIPELIDAQNGCLIAPRDEAALLEKMQAFLDGELRFDSAAIRNKYAQSFSAKKIGKELVEWYSLGRD